MVFKYRLNIIYNLVIVILISLLLLMLYLGNYNLIEGNTPAQVLNNINSSIQNNQDNAKVLQGIRPNNSACSSIDAINAGVISGLGGAQTPEAQTVQDVNQSLATLCSKNRQTNTQTNMQNNV
jgi:hypothetical protein